MTKRQKLKIPTSAVSTKKRVSKYQLAKSSTSSTPSKSLAVPVVALGASAGGLEALETVFNNVSANLSVAYVVISHLDPNHSSVLPELLQRTTKLRVRQVSHEMPVESNCVYVIPPGKNLVIRQGVFKLVERRTASEILPIDLFFQSLVEESGRKIIGVILSGAGTDGTQGVRAISAAGGLVIVQDPATTEYNSMPNSAIRTGLADYVLPPAKIPEYITKYLNYGLAKDFFVPDEEFAKEFRPICDLLHAHLGHDFSLYKHNTICRRIEKRMSIHQIDNIATYTRYLQHNPNEIQILFKDLLIGVTSFFRNPEAFKALRSVLIDKILKTKSKDQSVRVWVPACATGEEVYSIAILLQECMDELNSYFNVQIFGTDIDEAAIEIARVGLYPCSISADLGEARLKRFFTLEEGLYRVNKDIRKMIIFAPQTVTRDSPFTKVDLLSCRNLLIYFTAELQKKLLPLFHYSLNHNGVLFLGTAESINGFMDLFNVIDKKWKIFERKESASSFQGQLTFDHSTMIDKTRNIHSVINGQKPKETNIAYLVEAVLLESYAPACIVLDDKDNIIYIHGRAGKYLEPTSGLLDLNILHMARSGLKVKIAAALRQLVSQKKQVSYNNLEIKDDDNKVYYIKLKVSPFCGLGTSEGWKLLIIEEVASPEFSTKVNSKNASTSKLLQHIKLLENELKQSKENLQITIEELETLNEELKSSNEELQSTNEELQSTNEELETSKEELQSLNEELTTVNSELEARIEELSSANDDIQNLLYSTEVATIFLDNDLHIKWFTPKVTELMSLIQTDIGRSVADIVPKFKYDNLVEDSRKVIETLHSKIVELQSKANEWYQVRILPYRTLTNVIDGVVVTFLNINAQKQAEEKVKQLNETMQNIHNHIALMMDTVHEPLLMLNENLHVMSANVAFREVFQVGTTHIHKHSIYSLWDQKVPKDLLQQLFEEKLKGVDYCNNFTLTYTFKENNLQKIIINARRIQPGLDNSQILLAITLDRAAGEICHD